MVGWCQLSLIFPDKYYPALAVNPSEMTALEELPEFAKDDLFPIIKFSPWATSKEYSKSVDRVVKAVGNRLVIASIDQSYSSTSKEVRPARLFHNQIVSGENRERDWLEFIEPFENLIPCFGVSNDRIEKLKTVVEQGIKLGRGVVLQLNAEASPDGSIFFKDSAALISILERELNNENLEEIGVLIDCGHCLNLERSRGDVENLVNELREFSQIHIIFCSGTFPASFVPYEKISLQKIDSRLVFDAVKVATNAINLSYSDLSSTRLGVSKSSGGSKHTPKRIDYPLSKHWVISRHKTEGWSFQTAAVKLMESKYWDENRPDVYGVKRIEATASNTTGKITTLGTNTTARINIHLYVQSQYGSLKNVISTDEPYQD